MKYTVCVFLWRVSDLYDTTKIQDSQINKTREMIFIEGRVRVKIKIDYLKGIINSEITLE